MLLIKVQIRKLTAVALVAAICGLSVPTKAQDLVTIGSITGSSSIFVFRSAARVVKRLFSAFKPTRTKAQRLETAVKIKKQYETLAKVEPRRERTNVLDPTKLPANARTLPAAQGSTLFAGVGEYYVDKGDYDKAIEFFTDAVALDATNLTAKKGFSEALTLKGTGLLSRDQAPVAKALFLEALKYNPTNSAALFGLAEVYSELDQTAEAITAYEKSLESDKALTEIYVPLGVLYFQAGEIAKADGLLTKAAISSADSAQTHFFLGLVRSSQNRNDEALDAFQKAKSIDPAYADAYFQSGEILVRLKRLNEAIVDYQKATALRPNYFEAFLGLGETLFEIKNYPEALFAFKTAVKLKNDSWEAYAGLAESYRITESFNDAEANYNLAALFYMRNKDFNRETTADFYSKVGYVIGRQCEINTQKGVVCKWNTAIKALEKAIDLGGNSLDNANLGWAYYNAARMDIDSGMVAEARPKLELAKLNLEKALVGNPAIADGVLQNLGAVQIDLGDFNGAIASLKPVADSRPEWNFSRYALATAYFKVNDFENAAKSFRIAVDRDPNNVSLLMSLGVTEIRRKNGKEVRKIIDRMKVLNPSQALSLEQQAKVARI